MKQFCLFPPNHRGIRASRGNAIIEYAIVLSLVIAVFYAMNVYFKRGVQGKIKDMTDEYISNGIPEEYRQSTVTDSAERSASTTVASDITEKETNYIGGGRKLEIPKSTTIVDSTARAEDEELTFTGEYTPVEESNAPEVVVQDIIKDKKDGG